MNFKRNLLSVSQLAEYINMSPKTIYEWVHKGKIPYYKFVGSLRFDLDEINRWIKSNKSGRNGKANIL